MGIVRGAAKKKYILKCPYNKAWISICISIFAFQRTFQSIFITLSYIVSMDKGVSPSPFIYESIFFLDGSPNNIELRILSNYLYLILSPSTLTLT